MTAVTPFPVHPFWNNGASSGPCQVCGSSVTLHDQIAYSWAQIDAAPPTVYCWGCQRYSDTGLTDICRLCELHNVVPVFAVAEGPPPRQRPLFTLPPIAEAMAWKIEFRWRDGEVSILAGIPYPTTWMFHSSYKNKIKAQNRLRSCRRNEGRRKLFRIAPFLFTHQGDIECHVPLPPEPKPEAKPVPICTCGGGWATPPCPIHPGWDLTTAEPQTDWGITGTKVWSDGTDAPAVATTAWNYDPVTGMLTPVEPPTTGSNPAQTPTQNPEL